MALEWDQGFLDDMKAGKYDWVAFLVCPRCRCTWRGILPGERAAHGIDEYGPIEEMCPDCEMDDDLALDDQQPPEGERNRTRTS